MKLPPFEYAAPETVDEVLTLLREHGDDAKLLAGGQSLMPLLALRMARPGIVVDINRVAGLSHVHCDRRSLVLGPLVRQCEIEREERLRGYCPMIPEAVENVGHVAIRNRGTVGGSISHADPAAEWPALALALDAECDVVGPSGTRTISAPELFLTYFTTSIAADELLTEVRLPLPEGRAGSSFVEFARRHGDFAIAGVAALVVLETSGTVADARVALIGVKDTAVRARAAESVLLGERPTDERLAQAAAAVDSDISPASDVRGSASDRRQWARVLTRRALETARARAEGNGRQD